jgi:ribosomal protein S18 acetylase RimI-like enzyme
MQEPVHESLTKQITIRRFEPRDQKAVFNVYCSTLEKLGLLTVSRVRNFEDIQKTYLEKNYGDFLVGEVDGQIVATGGYSTNEENPGVAVIRRMYTLPDHQGQGVGRKILEQLEKEIKSKPQFKKMELFTAKEMTNAQQLYEKMGFVKSTEQSQSDGFTYEKPVKPILSSNL